MSNQITLSDSQAEILKALLNDALSDLGIVDDEEDARELALILEQLTREENP